MKDLALKKVSAFCNSHRQAREQVKANENRSVCHVIILISNIFRINYVRKTSSHIKRRTSRFEAERMGNKLEQKS